MIYTFYSYKGGVGRSMALANIAELFFNQGLRVLVIDWDLEAPGLEHYFPVDKEEILDQPGVMDILLNYKQRMAQDTDVEQPLQIDDPKTFSVNIYPNESKGELRLITAGRRKNRFKDYARSVLTFDWKDFYDNWEGERFFELFRQQIEKISDVVLIDSRTGLTEMGGVCTYHLADAVILFCSANEQSIEGTLQMLKDFSREEVLKFRNNRQLKTLVVPSRIEKTSELEDLNAFRKKFAESFKEYMPMELRRNEELFKEIEIPYFPKYSFKEIIAVNRIPNSSLDAPELSRAYNSLFQNILKLATSDLFEKIDTQTDVGLSIYRPDIEFVGRISELQFMTNSIYGPPYILIDSPKGYGKTRLMKAVKDELEKQNWLCLSIDLKEEEFSSIVDIAFKLLILLNKKNNVVNYDLTNPEDAGGQVGRCLLNALTQVNKKAVLIQIDTLEKIDRDLINDLLTKFVPTLAATIHQSVNIKLKIMLAGCYIAEWEKYNYEIPVKVVQLSPFDFTMVYQSVESFDSSTSLNMKYEYKKDFSAWLMFFTGGHPRSIAELLIKNYGMPMNLMANKEKELYKTIINPISVDIKKQINNEFRDIILQISVVRRFNARLLKNLIENKLIQWNGKDEYELEDLLCQTYLATRKDGFLSLSDIFRRSLAIDLRKNNLKLFIRICEQTISFYEERLKDRQSHGRHIIAIEILFQKLQYISCKKNDNKKRFLKDLEVILKSLEPMDDSVVLLENFKQVLVQDWEFRFMLNYLFREGSYDDRPFNEFIKIIIDFLVNLKKGQNI